MNRIKLYVTGFSAWSGEFSGPRGKRYGKRTGSRARRREGHRTIRELLVQ